MLCIIATFIFISCVRKHRFDTDKKILEEKKMATVLTDVFLMEAYVNEQLKWRNSDSVSLVRKIYYPDILKHHKIDSTSFFATLRYYQAHPKEYSSLLVAVDSLLYKIKALDTTTAPLDNNVVIPPNINDISSYKKQEQAMGEEYIKNNPVFKNFKRKNGMDSK